MWERESNPDDGTNCHRIGTEMDAAVYLKLHNLTLDQERYFLRYTPSRAGIDVRADHERDTEDSVLKAVGCIATE